jgi:hypothetical protein
MRMGVGSTVIASHVGMNSELVQRSGAGMLAGGVQADTLIGALTGLRKPRL